MIISKTMGSNSILLLLVSEMRMKDLQQIIINLCFAHLILFQLRSKTTVAQEFPTLAIPNINETNNVSYRSDFCKRQSRLFANQLSIEDALRGLNISVLMLEHVGVAGAFLYSPSEEGTIRKTKPGLKVEMMDEIARRAGFEWRQTFSSDRIINIIGSNTTNEFLKWSTDMYDVSAEVWDVTQEGHALGVAFPHSLSDNSVILVTFDDPNDNKRKMDILSFMKPFTYGVWGLIMLNIIFSGLTYRFLVKPDKKSDYEMERQQEDNDEEDGDSDCDEVLTISTSLYKVAMAFTGNFDFEAETLSTGIWTFSLAFWVLLILAAYTANLASFLVLKNPPVRAVNGIEDAVSQGAKICVASPTRKADKFMTKYPQGNFVKKPSNDVLSAVKNGKCQYALIGKASFNLFSRNSYVNVGCGFSQIGDIIESAESSFGIAIDAGYKCTSLVYHVFDYYLLQMEEEGYFDELSEKYLRLVGDQICNNPLDGDQATLVEEEEIDNSLSFHDAGGIFIIHYVLSIIAIGIAFSGPYYKKHLLSSAEATEDAGLSSNAESDQNNLTS